MKNLLKWKMESRNVHSKLYVKVWNEGFIILLISFSSLLASSFWNVHGVIWASYSSLRMCMKEENNRLEKKPFQFFDDQNKILVGLKVHCWTKSYLKMGKDTKYHMHHYCPYSCRFLQCTTKANCACSMALTW